MKQFAVILLLGFFIFDSVGFYFFSESEIGWAKSDAKQSILSHKKELVTFVFSKNPGQKISWTGFHEFRYGNEKYDIVSEKRDCDRIIYSCYPDKKESRAIACLSDQLKNKTDQSSSNNSSKPQLKEFDKYVSKSISPSLNQPLIFSFSDRRLSIPDDLFHLSIPTPPPNFS